LCRPARTSDAFGWARSHRAGDQPHRPLAQGARASGVHPRASYRVRARVPAQPFASGIQAATGPSRYDDPARQEPRVSECYRALAAHRHRQRGAFAQVALQRRYARTEPLHRHRTGSGTAERSTVLTTSRLRLSRRAQRRFGPHSSMKCWGRWCCGPDSKLARGWA
jgi:hypothetical protein